MQKEDGPKKISLRQAVLCMLWIIPSTVSGIMVAWDSTLSRSFSDQPEPFSAFRCRTITSLDPVDTKGGGFPSITEQKFLGCPDGPRGSFRDKVRLRGGGRGRPCI